MNEKEIGVDKTLYEQQESKLSEQSAAFIELLTKRGILEDARIDDDRVRQAKKEKKKNMYHNTFLLLQHYRSILWTLECFPANVAEELDRPLQDLDTLLDRLDLELGLNNRKLESRMESIRRSRLLVDRLNEAVSILKTKPVNGHKMYDIIYMTFLGPDKLTHEELLYRLDILRLTPDIPTFYLARDFKKINPTEQNKTMFTRITGALFYPGGCYAVYNTRDAAMKWSGMGEFKALHSLIELARMNAGLQSIDSAILTGASYETALETLLESERSRRLELRFDGIYRHIYFAPMNANGIRQLRLLTLPNWNERLLDLLFDPDTRSYNRGFMEYDASIGETYILSHLDGDLARLIRFREAQRTSTKRFEVLCFAEQAPFLHEYLGQRVILKELDRSVVERELGL